MALWASIAVGIVAGFVGIACIIEAYERSSGAISAWKWKRYVARRDAEKRAA